MVEIFAGSARLARACRHVGCRSVAVDKTTDRSHGTKIFVCDVTKPEELDMLKQFLEAEKDNLGWVHFAPACGTASKAREKPNRALEKAGFRVPKPLRSVETPVGVTKPFWHRPAQNTSCKSSVSGHCRFDTHVGALGGICYSRKPDEQPFLDCAMHCNFIGRAWRI